MAAIRPLVLSPDILEAIRRVVDYAEHHRFSHDAVQLALTLGQSLPTRLRPELWITVPFGYRCCFSISEGRRGVWVRQLSISVLMEPDGSPAPIEDLPSIEAAKELMKTFGFKAELLNCAVFLEPISEGRQAVDICERVDGVQIFARGSSDMSALEE